MCKNNNSKINVFGKVPFKDLQYLNLSYNEISNIDVLSRVPFKELNVQDLSNYKINQSIRKD